MKITIRRARDHKYNRTSYDWWQGYVEPGQEDVFDDSADNFIDLLFEGIGSDLIEVELWYPNDYPDDAEHCKAVDEECRRGDSGVPQYYCRDHQFYLCGTGLTKVFGCIPEEFYFKVTAK